jgi:hypothetical protein
LPRTISSHTATGRKNSFPKLENVVDDGMKQDPVDRDR